MKLVLGSNYFDPCPIDPGFDGLEVRWQNRCFINPPYGAGHIDKWVRKGSAEFLRDQAKRRKAYIWLVNYGNNKNRILLKSRAVSVCDLWRRIDFINPDTGKPQKGNNYNQMIYLWAHDCEDLAAFDQAFQDIGEVFTR